MSDTIPKDSGEDREEDDLRKLFGDDGDTISSPKTEPESDGQGSTRPIRTVAWEGNAQGRGEEDTVSLDDLLGGSGKTPTQESPDLDVVLGGSSADGPKATATMATTAEKEATMANATSRRRGNMPDKENDSTPVVRDKVMSFRRLFTRQQQANTADKEGFTSPVSVLFPSRTGTSALPLIALGVGVAALVVGAVGGWLVFTKQGQVEQLTSTLQQLQQNQSQITDTSDGEMAAEIVALKRELRDVRTLVSGPISHLSESSNEANDAILKRLEELEKSLVGISGQQQGDTVTPDDATPAPAPLANRTQAVTVQQGAEEVVTEKGKWQVILFSLSLEVTADAEMQRLRTLGIPAESIPYERGDKRWYRLVVRNFADYEGARSYALEIERKFNVKGAWPTPQ